MKKILLLVSSTLLLASTLFAQNDDDKKVRFGLKGSPTPTWLRSDDVKSVEKSSTKLGFGFGLQMEFRINSTASFVTGIGGDFLGGKQSYKNGQGYILDKNNQYVESKNTTWGSAPSTYSTSNIYEIKSRNVKTTYVTIPVLLKLMTKDISGMKYFGMFGGNIAIQTKFKADDEVVALKYNSTTSKYEVGGSSTITDMRPSGDLIPVNFCLNVGIGLEYNLSGTTSAFFSVNYLRGFINQYQKTSDIMIDKIAESLNNSVISKEISKSKQNAFADGIQLNIGILF